MISFVYQKFKTSRLSIDFVASSLFASSLVCDVYYYYQKERALRDHAQSRDRSRSKQHRAQNSRTNWRISMFPESCRRCRKSERESKRKGGWRGEERRKKKASPAWCSIILLWNLISIHLWWSFVSQICLFDRFRARFDFTDRENI